MKQATFLKINPADSVIVCLQPKQKGDIIEIDGLKITVNQDTPAEGWRLGEREQSEDQSLRYPRIYLQPRERRTEHPKGEPHFQGLCP